MDLTDLPRAESWPVGRLVTDATRGLLRMPSFQRDLRWTADDVAMLFDSLARGYPIGSLLLWRGAPAPAGPVLLGPVVLQDVSGDSPRWVVDGQQRVTALALGLTPLGERDPRFRIFFDPDDRTFHPARTPEPHWLPVPVLRDAAALGEFLLSWPMGTPERRRAALEVGARIRDYQIPTYVIESATEAPLREVFRRLNRQGKTMTEAEVFDALVPSAHRLGDIGDLVAQFGWGRVHVDVLLRAAMTHGGLDPTQTLDAQRDRPPPPIGSALLNAIERAISFLREETRVPHAALLPYTLPLVVLPSFFARHPRPSARGRRLLRRFVARGFVHPPTPAVLRACARAVTSESSDEHIAAQMLDIQLDFPQHVWIEPFKRARRDAAAVRVALLALATLGPLDPVTGDRLDVTALPLDSDQLLLARIGNDAGHPYSSTVASWFLHRTDADFTGEMIDAVRDASVGGRAQSAILQSHGISDTAGRALVAGDIGAFLELRAGTITTVADEFIAELAEWYEDDRVSLAAALG